MMIDLTRRTILGGMLSILASASTQIIPAPAKALAGNSIPRIFGDGKNYDSEGFQALFDGKDVIIPRDKLQVTSAKGLIFHRGIFVIDKEIYTNGCRVEIEFATFDGRLLKWWEAFFSHPHAEHWGFGIDARRQLGVKQAIWQRSEGHMAIDVGGHQFATNGAWMSEQNRFRPKVPDEPYWNDELKKILRRPL